MGWVKELESYILLNYGDHSYVSDVNESIDSDYDSSEGENSNSKVQRQIEELQKQINFLSTHFLKNKNELPTKLDEDEESDKEDSENEENLKPITSRADDLHYLRGQIDKLQQQMNCLSTAFVKIQCDLTSDVDEVEKSENDEEFENIISQAHEFQSQEGSPK